MSYLDRVRQRLTSAAISDMLDSIGKRNQCLNSRIVPMTGASIVAGYAFPVAVERVNEVPSDPFRGLVSALDAISPDEVFVTPTAGSSDIAVWGELLSTAAQARGAAGAVTDGLMRDVAAVREMRFPVFATGTVPYDSKGRVEVIAHGVSCTIDDVLISPGDLIFGDWDGVVVVPSADIQEVTGAAFEKLATESRFRESVASGMTASAAYELFGVL